MKQRPPNLPALYVEGADDVSVVSALLARHGVDTNQGKQHLWIQPFGSLEELLKWIPETILAEREHPTGFVLDIDIEITHRWQAVRGRLDSIQIATPDECPHNGFVHKLPNCPHNFGVWLMPDCKTDGQTLEHLVQSLLPPQHPLWPHAQSCTDSAAGLVDDANAELAEDQRKWKRFSDKVRIKAELRCWLAWQSEPGAQFGAAINDHILDHDSEQAIAFLEWLQRLYGFSPSVPA